uniref:CobW family GTP-binding protein n=1 Tax=Prevotella sp. TaxID=59823 RepID=UPI004028A2C5
MNSRKEIPVLLLTGYLGSGKTTLLNKILANQKGIKFAVIVNDIGEVNIDAALIEQGGVVGKKDDSLVALQNGCICCTLKMDLVEQLKEIVDMQKFDYIVIEASGICEPAPIAQTICSIPTLGPQYVKNGVLRLDSIVTVVDALRMKDEFAGGDDLMKDNIDEEDLASLVIQQIEFCNIILLNKAAEVEPKGLDTLKHIIKAIQPKAEIFECNYGDVDLDKIVNTRKFDWETVATSAGWIQEIEAERNEDHHDHDDHDDDDDDDEHEHDEHDHHHHHDHDHHHHHHHDDEGEAEEYGIGTFVYYSRKPFDLGLFDDFVARKWPRDVVRAKGICYFADERDMCYVFEQAGRQKTVKQAGQWIATMPKDQLDELLAREE